MHSPDPDVFLRTQVFQLPVSGQLSLSICPGSSTGIFELCVVVRVSPGYAVIFHIDRSRALGVDGGNIGSLRRSTCDTRDAAAGSQIGTNTFQVGVYKLGLSSNTFVAT